MLHLKYLRRTGGPLQESPLCFGRGLVQVRDLRYLRCGYLDDPHFLHGAEQDPSVFHDDQELHPPCTYFKGK